MRVEVPEQGEKSSEVWEGRLGLARRCVVQVNCIKDDGALAGFKAPPTQASCELFFDMRETVPLSYRRTDLRSDWVSANNCRQTRPEEKAIRAAVAS